MDRWTDGRTDGPTNRWTDPNIESLVCVLKKPAENMFEAQILVKNKNNQAKLGQLRTVKRNLFRDFKL